MTLRDVFQDIKFKVFNQYGFAISEGVTALIYLANLESDKRFVERDMVIVEQESHWLQIARIWAMAVNQRNKV
jgi:hypothetical protein